MVLPCSVSTCATISESTIGPNAMGKGNVSSYCVMVTRSTAGRVPVSKPSNPSTASATPEPRVPSPEPLDELLHERQSRLGRRIASVEPGVNGDRQIMQMAEPDGSREMVIERVHAAAADQSEQVQRSPAPLHGGAQLHERR